MSVILDALRRARQGAARRTPPTPKPTLRERFSAWMRSLRERFNHWRELRRMEKIRRLNQRYEREEYARHAAATRRAESQPLRPPYPHDEPLPPAEPFGYAQDSTHTPTTPPDQSRPTHADDEDENEERGSRGWFRWLGWGIAAAAIFYIALPNNGEESRADTESDDVELTEPAAPAPPAQPAAPTPSAPAAPAVQTAMFSPKEFVVTKEWSSPIAFLPGGTVLWDRSDPSIGYEHLLPNGATIPCPANLNVCPWVPPTQSLRVRIMQDSPAEKVTLYFTYLKEVVRPEEAPVETAPAAPAVPPADSAPSVPPQDKGLPMPSPGDLIQV